MQMDMVLGKEQPLHPLWEQHAHHHLPLLLAVENEFLIRFLIYTGYMQNVVINTVAEYYQD